MRSGVWDLGNRCAFGLKWPDWTLEISFFTALLKGKGHNAFHLIPGTLYAGCDGPAS